MALTKISTDGVKDDAITKAKIPADQIEASELANNAVDTNAIQDDAVTEDKLANSINSAIAANTAKDLTALSASNLTSGTVPDARFPATLPAVNGSALTGLSVGRNLAMNGDMRINQKGGSSSTSNGWRVAVDGWRTWSYAHGGTCTSSQGTVASGTTPHDLGFRYTYKLAMSGSLSAAATSSAFIANAVEGRNIIRSGWNYTSSSSYITVSFWVRASVAQDYAATIFMSGNRNYGWTFTVSSANTWQKITKTIPGDSSISMAADENAASMSLYIFAWIGSTYDDISSDSTWTTYNGTQYSRPINSGWLLSTNPVFEITGVQIEAGSSATSFEWEDFNTTLDKCQRHYIRLTGVGGAGQSYSADSVDGMRWFISWPNKMNTSPTVTRTGGSDGQSNANLAIVQSTVDGCTMNLKSTDSNTSVWWYNGTVEAVADI